MSRPASPEMRGRIRRPFERIAFIGAAIVSMGTAFYISCSSMFLVVVHGGSLQDSFRNYYAQDQLTYLAISQNVAAGHGISHEPLTNSGHSIYPSAYYWVIGMFAWLTHTNVFFAWNALGALVIISILGLSAFVGVRLCRSKWGVLCAALPFTVNSYQFYVNRQWGSLFGTHNAVIWAPEAILFNPSAEVAALGLSIATVALWLQSRTASHPLRFIVGSGLVAGLTFSVHTYVALFLFFVFGVLFFIDCALMSKRREVKVAVGITGPLWLIVLFAAIHMALAHWVLGLVAFLAPIFAITEWRKRLALQVLAFYSASLVMGLPMFIAIARDLSSPNSFFKVRQQFDADIDQSLPVIAVLVWSVPALLVSVVALLAILKQEDRRERNTWLALLGASFTGGTLLVFNAAWGLNQEPYRFFPYTIMLLLVVSGPALVKRGNWRHNSFRAVVLLALAVTLPTTKLAYDYQHSSVATVVASQRHALTKSLDTVARPGLIYTDECVDSRIVTSVTDFNVADYNAGLAIPLNRASIDVLVLDKSKQQVPTDADLRAAGVSGVVLRNSCNPEQLSAWEQRLGAPKAVLPTTEPGHNDDSYMVFDVPPSNP